LSTSATESIYEHDRRIVRTPRTVSVVAHQDSSFRGWLHWFQIHDFLADAGRWSAANREFTGQGREARWRVAPHCLVRLSLRSLATRALPQPDRPGHLLSQTRGAAGWRFLLRRGHRFSMPSLTSLPDARRFRDMRLSGPPHTLLREEPRAPLHPRCLPSSDESRPGLCCPLPQSVPSLWSAGNWTPFQSSASRRL
jgi:hypothetical protein